MNRSIQVRPGRGACGFCATGARHDLCPSGVLNGNGLEVVTCQCGCERSQQIKCLDCGTRDTDRVNTGTWRCFEPDDCRARIEARLAAHPTIQQIRAIEARVKANKTAERASTASHTDGTPAPRPAKTPRATAGSCLHCGEPTKGGKFLPGHDSAYLSDTIKRLTSGEVSLPEVLTSWTGAGISEALQNKLQKRVVVA